MRVGFYLESLEDALRAAYPAAPATVFRWEKMLAETIRRGKWWRANYEWHDFGAIAIFALIAYGSVALGAYRTFARHEAVVVAIAIIEILLLTAIAIRFLREVATSRRKIREHLKKSSSSRSDPTRSAP
jgi:hypothetical protein